MSLTILSRTINSVLDKKLVLSNAQAARLISIGTSWNTIRIAARWALTDTGASLVGTPRLYLGMLASPSAGMANGPLGSTTSHFVGVVQNTSSITRTVGPPLRYLTSMAFAKRVGNTSTIVTGTSTSISAQPDIWRTVHIMELAKGSPFTISHVVLNSTTGMVDVSNPDWIKAALQADTIANAATSLNTSLGVGTGYTSASNTTLTVNEATDGFLNAVCIGWNRSDSVLELSDLLFVIKA